MIINIINKNWCYCLLYIITIIISLSLLCWNLSNDLSHLKFRWISVFALYRQPCQNLLIFCPSNQATNCILKALWPIKVMQIKVHYIRAYRFACVISFLKPPDLSLSVGCQTAKVSVIRQHVNAGYYFFWGVRYWSCNYCGCFVRCIHTSNL